VNILKQRRKESFEKKQREELIEATHRGKEELQQLPLILPAAPAQQLHWSATASNATINLSPSSSPAATPVKKRKKPKPLYRREK
jgi:hypothetical protein